MISELAPGRDVKEVWSNDGVPVIVGRAGVIRILVVEIPGNGAMTPWLKVITDKGEVSLLNPSYMVSIVFA